MATSHDPDPEGEPEDSPDSGEGAPGADDPGAPAEAALESAEDFYPPSPRSSPELLATTGAYRLRVVSVLVSLFTFLALYLGLVAGSIWLVHAHITMKDPNVLLIAGAAMLALFMVKGLFQRNRVDTDDMVEAKEEDQPLLFAFVRRLCEECGSPFPAKIYLDPEVNAAVFYRRSLLSIVWPSRKNLLIGMGLAKALSLSEFKAVLAHEFGHFAQASMRLGQYVYLANQVICDMVYGRDFWDDLLRKWRGIDLRVAWIAWVLTVVVWLLRGFLKLLFRLINIFNLSLSRQMEFAADRHAVAMAGSDTHIGALWKINRAAAAMRIATSGLESMTDHTLYTDDLFSHQRAALERLDGLLRKALSKGEDVGVLLGPYRPGRAIHFKEEEGEKTSLWHTHPSDHDREVEAKRLYVPAKPDERPADGLFRLPAALTRRLTAIAYRPILGRLPKPSRMRPATEIEEKMREEREEQEQAPHYHGLFDNRIVEPGDVDAVAAELDAAEASGAPPADEARAAAAAWTGEPLKIRMAEIAAMEKDVGTLERLESGEEKIPSGGFAFRGKAIVKKDVPRLLEKVREEVGTRRGGLAEADRAFFRHFYLLSGRAEAGAASCREELMKRYRCLLGVQKEIGRLNDIEREFFPLLQQLQGAGELSEGDYAAARSVLKTARARLVMSAKRCQDIRLPAVSHLEEDATAASFVFPGPLLGPLPEENIPGPWVGKLVEQFSQAIGRLRKLHYKNLGQLLRLQESLAPGLFPEAGNAPANP